mgnify:FL=1
MGARRGSSPSSSDWSNAAGGVFAGRQGEEETGNWVSESQDPSSSRAWSARRSRSTYQEARCSRSPVTKVAMSVQGSPDLRSESHAMSSGRTPRPRRREATSSSMVSPSLSWPMEKDLATLAVYSRSAMIG